MIGKTILHYKILAKLGEGGMGVVYKAEDTKLKRIVAIKFLPRQIAASDNERLRFKIEAQAAAALNHPNIATIYAIEEVDGEMFIVMEFIDGQELRKLIIDNSQLSIDNCLAYATQIAEGLKAAHAKGITHRDIKSSNAMVTESGQVKIMDFGLAKMNGDIHLTKAGTTLGTVAYMSPEQARGEEVDRRADIWAFGVVLYELLCGQLPFRGEYEAAMMYSILNEKPQPLIPTGAGRTDVPMELEHIVNRCLEKQAAHRYQHVEDLLADLRRCKLEPKSTLRPFQPAAAATSSRKRLFTRVLPLALLLVAISFGIGYIFFSREAESKERIPIVVVDFVNETGEKELDGLSGMLITALEQSRRLSVLTRSQMFDILKKSGKTEVDRIDETLGREICRQAEVKVMAVASIRKFGQVYLVDLKLLDAEKDRYLVTAKEKGNGQESIPDIIDRLAEQTRSSLKEQAAEIQMARQKVAEVTTLDLEAYQHYFLGEQLINKMKFAEAEEEFKQAIALDSTFGLAYYRLAYAVGWDNDELAKAPLQKALAQIERIPGKERYLVRAEQAKLEKGHGASVAILKEMEHIYPNDKEMLYRIGDYSYHAGQNTTAVEYLEKVLAMEPTHARALDHLRRAYTELEDYKRMVEYFEKFWASHPASEVALQQLAKAYETQRNYQKMVEVAERYLSATGSKDAYLMLGDAYTRIGNLPAAVNIVQKAQTLFAEDLEMSNAIGAIYFRQGDYDQAEAAYKRSLSQNNNARTNTSSYLGLDLIYTVTGRYKKAIQVEDQIIEPAYRANDIAGGAYRQLSKGRTIGEVMGDREAGWQEVQKTFQYHKEIPPDHSYWPLLVNTSILFGHLDFAEQIAREKFSQGDPMAHARYMAWLLGYSGKCDETKPLAEKLLATGDENDKIQALWVLAYCDFKAGKYDQAIPYLKQLQAPPHASRSSFGLFYPKSFSLLGEIYEKKGEAKLAIENYEKLLALWKHADPDLPDLIEAKTRLAKLKGVAAK